MYIYVLFHGIYILLIIVHTYHGSCLLLTPKTPFPRCPSSSEGLLPRANVVRRLVVRLNDAAVAVPGCGRMSDM